MAKGRKKFQIEITDILCREYKLQYSIWERHCEHAIRVNSNRELERTEESKIIVNNESVEWAHIAPTVSLFVIYFHQYRYLFLLRIFHFKVTCLEDLPGGNNFSHCIYFIILDLILHVLKFRKDISHILIIQDGINF